MKRIWLSLIIALSATAFMLYQSGSFAQQAPQDAPAAVSGAAAATQQPAAGAPGGEKAESAGAVSIKLDKTSLENGGLLTITGSATPGKPVFLEIWAEKNVRVSRFDSEVDPDTGIRPYILYMTQGMPGYFKIAVPKTMKEEIDKAKKEGRQWSYSQLLKALGAEAAYSAPEKGNVDRYQASLMGSIIGSRGEQLPAMDGKENRRRSMQLVKARFRNPGKVFAPVVEVNADGTYSAKFTVDAGSPPGKYFVRAVAGKDAKSAAVTVENRISFPYVYLSNAGTSLNLFGPFLLTLVISIFGVLMGAGGGFILNPILVSLWPVPHTIVAGTVMPTVAFSQASGIYNYSKIKFINWKLGTCIGLAMLLGGFIGPKLTEMLTLDQYKFLFGWILVVLAALMFRQTMPGYIAKNKKEQAILKEFKKKAEEAAQAKAAKQTPAIEEAKS